MIRYLDPRYARKSRPVYASDASGRYTFCFDWSINGSEVAEIECAVDYHVRFGEGPSGYGEHFDPGSGDEIQYDTWYVLGRRRNPGWKEGDRNTPYHVYDHHPMPDWLLAMLDMEKIDEGISEEARSVRERVR